MSATLYLSRARLRTQRGETLSAIAPLLIPDTKNQQASHAHRVTWLLFQKTLDTLLNKDSRVFLWRDEGNGKYMLLSAHPPTDPHNLFELETKTFEPNLKSGDRLAFALRANPTLASKGALSADDHAKRARGKRVDVVMHALNAAASKDERKQLHAKGELALLREKITQEAGAAWLEGQGAKAGFALAKTPLIEGYTQIEVERRKDRRRPAGFSVLDFAGDIIITDPAVFRDRLAKGFGSAKAFGNGLMLIRRA